MHRLIFDTLLSDQQACIFLGLSLQDLALLVYSGRVSFVQYDSKLFFSQLELMRWQQKNKKDGING